MKFLIDEMPYFSNECPFYDASIGGICKCDGCICNYMSLPSQEKSEQTECKWLIQKRKKKNEV